MKLLRGQPSGRVYVHGEAGKRHISPNEMKALVAAGYVAVGVPDAQLNSIPNVEVEGVEYPLKAIKRATHGAVYATDGIYKWGITSSALWTEMKKKGLLENGQLAVVSDNLWNRISNRPGTYPVPLSKKYMGSLMRGAVWAIGTGDMNGPMRVGHSDWKPPVTLNSTSAYLAGLIKGIEQPGGSIGFSDADLQRIAKAVNDEQHRRSAA